MASVMMRRFMRFSPRSFHCGVCQLLEAQLRELARLAGMPDRRGIVARRSRVARGEQALPRLEPQRALGTRALHVGLGLREQRTRFVRARRALGGTRGDARGPACSAWR